MLSDDWPEKARDLQGSPPCVGIRRPVLFVWLSVRIENPNRRDFSFGLPLPAYLLYPMVDAMEDLLDFACLFPAARRVLREKCVGEITAAVKEFVWELLRTGPTDLVDVDVAEEDGRRVQVKCLLR